MKEVVITILVIALVLSALAMGLNIGYDMKKCPPPTLNCPYLHPPNVRQMADSSMVFDTSLGKVWVSINGKAQWVDTDTLDCDEIH